MPPRGEWDVGCGPLLHTGELDIAGSMRQWGLGVVRHALEHASTDALSVKRAPVYVGFTYDNTTDRTLVRRRAVTGGFFTAGRGDLPAAAGNSR